MSIVVMILLVGKRGLFWIVYNNYSMKALLNSFELYLSINRYPFNGCQFILTDPNGFSSRANGCRVFANGYADPSNGLMLTANGYMSLANGYTVRSNGLMLTSNSWANASNVLKKTF